MTHAQVGQISVSRSPVHGASAAATTTQTLLPTTSERLRLDLAATHAQLEQVMQLQNAIISVLDYATTLTMYLSVFAPLEDALARQAGWESLGIDFEQRRRSPALRADILALTGVSALHAAAVEVLPNLAFSLGVFYVLEGSALGGRVILRDLENRLGPAIAGATAFFHGRGAQTGPLWLALKHAIDAYGARHPGVYGQIAAGARHGFARFMQAARAASS